ncbi:MAG: Hsp20/alpha crystallin family protein [Solirubrobacteraceae bacterium]|nr:Hsp20/alpha crystallin family protein [Solirubrobacteraceae bacterium]
MSLVRWEPVSMNRLFTSLFDTPTGTAAVQRRWVPAMDLAETDDAYVLRADLPGLSPDDVRVEYENRALTISGERRSEHETEEAGYRRIERSFGAFRRTVTLPTGIDPEAITAGFENGVLTVRVPKPESAKPHKVEIAVSSESSK